jgi:hypothetical protein
MDFTWVDGFATILAVVVGVYLKRVDWFNTKFVPLGKLIVIALVKIATALGIGPSEAHAATVLIVALVWWKSLLIEFAKVLLETLTAVGAHSGPKNVIEGLEGKK